MIVAWQFTARECVLKKIRPVGYGLTWSTGAFTTQGRRTFPPTLRDKKPGPPVCIFDSTSNRPSEDEDDDEYEDDRTRMCRNYA